MRTIIAGGRDYQLTDEDLSFLASLPITEVVSGGATGADAGGEMFAYRVDIPMKRFKADWQTYGRAAGPMRNRQMAVYAEAVVLFPGGRGTNSMFNEAKKYELKIYDLRAAKSSEEEE